MKKFIGRLFVFVLPFLLALMPFWVAGMISKEILDFDKLIAIQRESDDMLLGMAYNEQTPYYKLQNANDIKADVMALGTSRVMQFREGYFDASFYNCGGAVKGHYNEYINFFKNLDEDALPQYLIIGLDAWNFNKEMQSHDDRYDEYQRIVKGDINELSIIKKDAMDYFQGKWSMDDLVHRYDNIGFNGIIGNGGYRKDGSYFHRDSIVNPQNMKDYEFRDTFARIEQGSSGYEYGEEIDPETLQCLEELLVFCKQNNMKVIAFLPPYAPAVFERMEETGKYQYVNRIKPAVEEIFEKYDYEIYDFTDVRGMGCDDSYFIDGFHGGEVVYGMMVREMYRADSVLQSVISIDDLETCINSRVSNKMFVEEE